MNLIFSARQLRKPVGVFLATDLGITSGAFGHGGKKHLVYDAIGAGYGKKSPLENKGSRNMVLPHSTELEQAVLAVCLNGSDYAAEVFAVLQTDDFYDPKHRIIYDAILELQRRSQMVDYLTVNNFLETVAMSGKAGGSEYINSLADKTQLLAKTSDYVRQIKELSQRRQLIFAMNKSIDACYSSSEDVATIVEQLAQQIYEISSDGSTKNFRRLNDVIQDKLKDIQEELSGHGPQILKTNYPTLDNLLGGLRKGALYILAARPGIGKTALALNIANNVAGKSNASVAIFSLEMDEKDVAMRFLISEAMISGKEMHDMTSDQLFEKIGDPLEKLAGKNIFLNDKSYINVQEIHSRVRQKQLELMQKKQNIDLVIVDYLQLISSGTKYSNADNRQQQIAEISRMLKVMARELDVPVIALSQINRDSAKGKGREPELSDLRESGAIEQDADVVIFLYKLKDDDEAKGSTEEIGVKVAKNRHGPTNILKLTWKGELMTFYDISSEYFGEAPPY